MIKGGQALCLVHATGCCLTLAILCIECLNFDESGGFFSRIQGDQSFGLNTCQNNTLGLG